MRKHLDLLDFIIRGRGDNRFVSWLDMKDKMGISMYNRLLKFIDGKVKHKDGVYIYDLKEFLTIEKRG